MTTLSELQLELDLGLPKPKLDLNQYAIGVDLWEGDDDPDFKLLASCGVKFAILRMNVSNGGLILDKQFHNWNASVAQMPTGAYDVISPFISRQQYTSWINANLPSDCNVISTDVEIQGTTASDLSKLVCGVISDQFMADRLPMNYSGYSMWNAMNPWPMNIGTKQIDQWWARYPGILHPPATPGLHGVKATWDELRDKFSALPAFDPIDGFDVHPGHIAIWQLTSSYILPGGPKEWPLDVNIMPLSDYYRIFGQKINPKPKTLEERVVDLENWVAKHG
jgi:hypothetical protein